MKVSVWDTYVKREDGKLIHFDILVSNELKDEKIILNYGKEYLKSKSFHTEELTSKECKFCHMAQANDEIIIQIKRNGFFIVEMEYCN